jgi:hypothetical protein
MRFVFFVDGLDFNPVGVGQERANDEPGLVTERLHAQQ